MLNQREAIYGFCAWLTTREQRTTFGASEDCAPIPDLIEAFCNANSFMPVSETWPLGLKFPIEKDTPCHK